MLFPRPPQRHHHAHINLRPFELLLTTSPHLLTPRLRKRLQVQFQHQSTLCPPNRPQNLHSRHHHAQRLRLLLHAHVPRLILLRLLNGTLQLRLPKFPSRNLLNLYRTLKQRQFCICSLCHSLLLHGLSWKQLDTRSFLHHDLDQDLSKRSQRLHW